MPLFALQKYYSYCTNTVVKSTFSKAVKKFKNKFYKMLERCGAKFVHAIHMDALLDSIISFTDNAHGSQLRKYTPERYIVHPTRVMRMLQSYTNDRTVLAAAIMHDVLEDTPVKADEISNFLKPLLPQNEVERTVELVKELTDEYVKEAYPHWNRRKRKEKEVERLALTSPDAQTIKYADIIDNCLEIVKYDNGFAPKFLSECRQILQKMNKGNKDLYQKAVESIEKGFELLNKKSSQQ